MRFRHQQEWNQVSNNVKPGGNFVVLDLDPASWYHLRVTAHNNAGFAVAEYEFATLTVTGGKHKGNEDGNGTLVAGANGGWIEWSPYFLFQAPLHRPESYLT